MPGSTLKSLMLDVPGVGTVTAKIDSPTTEVPGASALVLAHGANNDLDYPLLAYVAQHLASTVGATVMRFNFPYVERGAEHASDSLDTLIATLRRAFEHLAHEVVSAVAAAGIPIFVGGKSLGGRTAAEFVSRRSEDGGPEPAGLVELGYPLHAPGRTDRLNLKPLRHIDVPSLFCIGGHDPFCDLDLFRPLLSSLMAPAELYVVESGDHSFLLPRSSGRAPDAAYPEVAAKVAGFMTSVAAVRAGSRPRR